MRIDRVLLSHKKSLYQLYVKEHRHAPVQRALSRGDAMARRMVRSHQTQQVALKTVLQVLRRLHIETVVRYRANIRSTRGFDLVISVGGDGTTLDTSTRVHGDTPLLGINSDPTTSVGALCAGTVDELARLLERLRADELRPREVTRIRVRVGGKDRLGPCLNDVLYAHACPADLTAYELAEVPATRAPGMRPDGDHRFALMRSSGLWCCTAMGSTSAMRSAGGRAMPAGSRRLQYLVREPYCSPDQPRPRGKVRGMIEAGQALVLVSRVRRGMIWADGPHRRQPVAYGQQVIIDAHPSPLMLVSRGYRPAR